MPLFPQDKEGFGGVTSHAEKALFFFKESSCISFASLVLLYIFSNIAK
ncbi:hypothetical protein [Oceanobacillus salinisoli]|nr:hypothetical protein [Oceanobacillus salinisoli]